MKTFSLEKFPLEKKTVLVRVDYNVPLEKNKILDNTKIKDSLPLIKFLLKKQCKIVLMSHLGRPQGKTVQKLRLTPVIKELKKLLPKKSIIKLDDCIGKDIKRKIKQGKKKQIFVLDNLRFYKQEKENDPAFAHSLADLGDVYINDAFAVCHRKHASVDAITKFLPSLPGIQLSKEIFYLSKALQSKSPAVWIMGGSKLDKIDLIKQALKKADKILIGGALAFSFLRAKGVQVGLSKVDAPSIRRAKELLKLKLAKKIILPIDFLVAEKFSAQAKEKAVKYNEIKSGEIALDLGPQTINFFKGYLNKAKTVVWNGPLGYYEWVKYANSTKKISRILGKVNALKVCGGGETSLAIHKFHLTHNFSHVSTAGGASLTFLSGKKMPGLDALIKNYHQANSKKRKLEFIKKIIR
jgi:3-phosphoglycerate kinase